MKLSAFILIISMFCISMSSNSQPIRNSALVVANSLSQMSMNIADYYKLRRNIPQANILAIPNTSYEEINYTNFNENILTPVKSYIEGLPDPNSIRYIVLCKGIPLKISGTSDWSTGTQCSVDSELSLMFIAHNLEGKVSNPYYKAGEKFDRNLYNILLVTRLDGFNDDLDKNGIPDDIKNMIDNSQIQGSPTGKWLFDIDPYFDDWQPTIQMQNAKNILSASGEDVQIETTTTFISSAENLLGYMSYGSHDNKAPDNSSTINLFFSPGGIMTSVESYNARTFNHVGLTYSQWLVSDFIHKGAVGVFGNVYEPWVDGIVNAEILFTTWASGRYNLAETFYLAIPYLSWQGVVAGDPYCPEFDSVPPTPTPTPPTCVKGDVNQDQNVTPGDAILAFNIYLGVYNPPTPAPYTCSQSEAADMNSDGSITPSDALCIFLIYLRMEC